MSSPISPFLRSATSTTKSSCRLRIAEHEFVAVRFPVRARQNRRMRQAHRLAVRFGLTPLRRWREPRAIGWSLTAQWPHDLHGDVTSHRATQHGRDLPPSYRVLRARWRSLRGRRQRANDDPCAPTRASDLNEQVTARNAIARCTHALPLVADAQISWIVTGDAGGARGTAPIPRRRRRGMPAREAMPDASQRQQGPPWPCRGGHRRPARLARA